MSTLTTVYSFVKPAQGQSPWDGNVNGDFDQIDSELARPRYPYSSPTVAATTTLDLSAARTFVFTVSQATTIAFSNVPTSSFAVPIRCIITNGSAFALTWPASVVWLSGVAPTLKSSGVDLVELETKDGGTTWYAGALDRPLNRLVGQVTTDAGTGANTTEVTLHTVAIPANILGLNGGLRIRVHFSIAGATSTKQIAVYYGATQIGLVTFTSGQTINPGLLDIAMVNRNATNSQHMTYSASQTATTILYGGGTGAEDSTVAKNLTVKGLTPNAADEVTANVTLVELLRS